jgi:hypothetical protein
MVAMSSLARSGDRISMSRVPQGLDVASVDAIARRVVALLAEELSEHARRRPELIDAVEVARRLGISRSTVYEKSDELGAIRLGAGPRARLRFDARFIAALGTPRIRSSAGTREVQRPRRKHRRRRASSDAAGLLPIGFGVAR